MDMMDEKIIELWTRFYNPGLKHIIIGGFAVILHGHI